MEDDPARTRELIRELEQELADLQARLPAHSVSPSMIQALEEIEERLEAARRRLASESEID
ncbi:MAG: histidine kinase [Deltaproteobacteria bacterium]|nr:histidine kinase [Deltaproteobacteria bacterium]